MRFGLGASVDEPSDAYRVKVESARSEKSIQDRNEHIRSGSQSPHLLEQSHGRDLDKHGEDQAVCWGRIYFAKKYHKIILKSKKNYKKANFS